MELLCILKTSLGWSLILWEYFGMYRLWWTDFYFSYLFHSTFLAVCIVKPYRVLLTWSPCFNCLRYYLCHALYFSLEVLDSLAWSSIPVSLICLIAYFEVLYVYALTCKFFFFLIGKGKKGFIRNRVYREYTEKPRRRPKKQKPSNNSILTNRKRHPQ